MEQNKGKSKCLAEKTVIAFGSVAGVFSHTLRLSVWQVIFLIGGYAHLMKTMWGGLHFHQIVWVGVVGGCEWVKQLLVNFPVIGGIFS